MYARIASATFHLKVQDNRSYPSLASALPKGKLYNPGYCCSDKRRLDVEVLEQVGSNPHSNGLC